MSESNNARALLASIEVKNSNMRYEKVILYPSRGRDCGSYWL